jgi:hypothetical protein
MEKGINLSQQKDIARRLYALQIPPQLARAMVAEISAWTSKSGVEWTVKRLKDLKTDFVRIIAGLDPSSEWIKYHRGVPQGSFGKLFRMGILNPKITKNVLNALMVYSTFVSRKETVAQLNKFYDSLSSEPVSLGVLQNIFSLMLPSAKVLKVGKKSLRTVKDYVPSPSKRCPTSDGKTIEEEKWLETIDVLTETRLGRETYRKYGQLREVVKPLEKFVEAKHKRLPPYFFLDEEVARSSISNIGFAGKIGHIQEPGFKLRAVANPFRVYQLALSRFGDQLYELIQNLPWDCTHDQDAGTLWAFEKLKDHKMFAVDLSDATNQFPLQLQLMLLRQIDGIVEEDINLFEELSTAVWLSPTHGGVRWTKGQPLGLYPSFAAFALTHGVLVASLERELGFSGNGETFRILGDDIVISDPRVYARYREVLDILEVSVSESKTIQSDLITEFGGRVISRDAIMTLGKWRQSSDRSFLDVVANVGPRYIKYLPSRQRRIAEVVITLPKPVGLDINPAGIPAIVRFAMYKQLEHLYRSELDYPVFSKDQWTATLYNSSYAKSIVNTKVSLYSQSSCSEDNRVSVTPPGAPKRESEVLSRISLSTGVPIQPSSQFSSLAAGYTDVLERIFNIARDLKLNRFRSNIGDPRGPSVLEVWETHFKRDFVNYHDLETEDIERILNKDLSDR